MDAIVLVLSGVAALAAVAALVVALRLARRVESLPEAKLGPTWGLAVYELVTSLAFIVAIVAPLFIAVAYLTLWERKLMGWMQIRLGPNVTTFFGIRWLGGLAQPIADGVKLLF